MKFIYFSLLILIFNSPIAFAEEIFITYTDVDSEIVLDGLWTHSHEWKKSSETKIQEDALNQFVIRSAHNYEKIFVLVDVVVDESKNISEDKSIICFESKTQQNNLSNLTYCFEILFDGTVTTLMKNPESTNSQFVKIENHDDTKAISGMSNQYDRYSKTPHISYEFQIPIDVIGRSDVYAFYVEVYDAETNLQILWPQNSEEFLVSIENSETWGEMISPDKSIPEFSSPLIIFVILVSTMVLMQFKTKFSRNLFSF